MKVDLLLNDTGFDAGPALLGVHFKNAVQILRHVEDDGISDSLSRQARSATPRQDRHLEVARHLHRRKDVFVRLWKHHSYRFDFVNAGVCAVHKPRRAVKTHFTGDSLFQGLIEIVIHRAESLADEKSGRNQRSSRE